MRIVFCFLWAMSAWVVAQDQVITPEQQDFPAHPDYNVFPTGRLCGSIYERPICVRKVLPRYPERALGLRQRVEVVLYANVSPEGESCEVRVVQGLRYDPFGFEDEAIAAFKGYRYMPAKWVGKPIWSRVTIRFIFSPWLDPKYSAQGGCHFFRRAKFQNWLHRRRVAAQRKAAN